MKTKKQMSQQDSGKAPVTFHDVAACFSEEEWTILHEWQEELYKNVMKEIHQALISLGPVIATSVFSLRAKEKEDLRPADHQNSGRGPSNDHSLSAAVSDSYVFRTNREEKKDLRNHHDTDRRHSLGHAGTGMKQEAEGSLRHGRSSKGGESNAGPSSSDTVDSSGALFAIKGDENLDADRRERNDHFSPVSEASIPIISFSIHEAVETCAVSHPGSERRENAARHTGEEFDTAVMSFSIKEEGEPYFMDNQDSERKESSLVCAGVNQSVISMEQRAGSWKRASMTSEYGRSFSHTLDINNHPRMRPEETLHASTEYVSSLNQKSTPFKDKGTHTGQRPYACTEYGKNFRESATLSPHPETHTGLKLYICSQCRNCFSQSANEAAHRRINKGEQQNICSDCEKSLWQPTNLTKDWRKHMGEKPYLCRECGKSFRNSGTLMIHQRVHTGEKPYSCSQCGKDFRQLPHLVVHQRLHTGDKPYICNVCEKPFINSSNLRRHQQIHSRQLGIVTWTTEG